MINMQKNQACKYHCPINIRSRVGQSHYNLIVTQIRLEFDFCNLKPFTSRFTLIVKISRQIRDCFLFIQAMLRNNAFFPFHELEYNVIWFIFIMMSSILFQCSTKGFRKHVAIFECYLPSIGELSFFFYKNCMSNYIFLSEKSLYIW